MAYFLRSFLFFTTLVALLGTVLTGKWVYVAHLCMSYGKQGII